MTVIYEEPVIRPLGDLYALVEFGDELNLELNFRVITFDLMLKENPIRGVTETIPTHRSLALVYDPLVISYRDLAREIRALTTGLEIRRRLPSRLISIPVWYNDPWSHECAEYFHVPNNLDYLAELNQMSVDQVIQSHAGSEHWVAAVGFQPATYQAIFLDESKAITAPKYQRPRHWTYERTLCLAGNITSYYPVRSPGGYQLLGRTPVNLWDPHQRLPDFKESPVLARVGDRHRYVPIDQQEYHRLEQEWEAGRFRFEIEDGLFDLDEYYRSRGQTGTRAV